MSISKLPALALALGIVLAGHRMSHAEESFLTPQLTDALKAMEAGRATDGQKALLFANNRTINQARLNGWISDKQYQTCQADYATTNADLAKKAAVQTGAEFREQTRTKGFSPGTDSDYIVKTTSRDPVGQIREMQINYERNVNEYLKSKLQAEGIEFKQPKTPWSQRLDVDFMADPANLSQAQFEEVAKVNNDAYKRRAAAEYERATRAGEAVSPEAFREYALEMQDFIEKKQHKLEKIRANPKLLDNPIEMAEYHRMMAQEQKYLERIESANAKLRRQEGLDVQFKTKTNKPIFEVTYGLETVRDPKTGKLVAKPTTHIKTRSIADVGSARSYDNFSKTLVASHIADNSLHNASRELALSMAEAAKKNPNAWKSAPADIAEITKNLPPAQKGQLIQEIRNRTGTVRASEVADAMRKLPNPKPNPTLAKQIDDALKRGLKIDDDLAKLGGLRGSFHQKVSKILPALEKLGKLGTGLEIVAATREYMAYLENLEKAMDPNVSDAEANECFEKMQDAANNMIKAGLIGTVCELVPTFGAAYGAWTLGYDGTRWILESTETGQRLDRTMTNFFDRSQQGFDSALDRLTEMLGGTSPKMARADQLKELEKRYLDGIKSGRFKLKPGYTTQDLIAQLRAGDIWAVNELLEPNLGGLGKPGFGPYMVWTNDVGWLHVGNVRDFERPQTRGSEIWGGLSTDPLKKTALFGGKQFETQREAMEAVAAMYGGQVVLKRAPLAFPKVYYMAGDLKIGFEIVQSVEFKPFIEKANAPK